MNFFNDPKRLCWGNGWPGLGPGWGDGQSVLDPGLGEFLAFFPDRLRTLERVADK